MVYPLWHRPRIAQIRRCGEHKNHLWTNFQIVLTDELIRAIRSTGFRVRFVRETNMQAVKPEALAVLTHFKATPCSGFP